MADVYSTSRKAEEKHILRKLVGAESDLLRSSFVPLIVRQMPMLAELSLHLT
jgi:hypothetical protein